MLPRINPLVRQGILGLRHFSPKYFPSAFAGEDAEVEGRSGGLSIILLLLSIKREASEAIQWKPAPQGHLRLPRLRFVSRGAPRLI